MDVSTDQLLARVRSRYEIAGDDERSALEGILAMVPVIVSQAGEIERLKAELELRTKELDQATRNMTIDGNEIIIRHRHGDSVTVIAIRENRPELYACLAGRGE